VIVDYHMHLRETSGGAPNHDYTASRVEEYVERARAAGVDEIGLTEHVYRFRQTESLWEIPWMSERSVDDLDA
jgi:histidinol-phosphatase (PHP family)